MLKGLEAVTEHIVGQLKGLLCSAEGTSRSGRPASSVGQGQAAEQESSDRARSQHKT